MLRALFLLVRLLLCCGGFVLLPAQAATPLSVDGRSVIEVWPAVSVLDDATHQQTIEAVLARSREFLPPQGTTGNLGRNSNAVWLRLPLQVPGTQAQRRVLELDYPSLNLIEVYLVQQGRVLSRHVLGNQLRYADRPLPSRAHAVALDLPAGDSQILMRVQTTSSMVLPMTLRTPDDFTAHESGTHLLQGIILGLGLCMLIYSLTHWISLRDGMFLQYAALLGGNIVFMLSYFGIGPQYLWPDSPQLSQQVAPLAVLVAVAAGASFINSALVLRESHVRMFWLLRGCAATASLSIVAAVLGWIDYRTAQNMATLLGVGTLLTMVPVAFIKVLRGDRVALYMLCGWTVYLLGAAVITSLLRGYAEPSFVVQYFFPLSTMVEMAAWMGVLGLRVQTIHRSADRARVESEALRTLAHTDALTGLPNRRGLQDKLAVALPLASPQQLLAVYLLDLDGFKPINDKHGHDVGDALLVAVGQRLQGQLRGSDVVARLGGDEFVVLASGLTDEAAARAIGQKMLTAFDTPFAALGQLCEVGLTIGYALAPFDGHSADDLIKRADAAMYAGKQAGRRCLQRGGRSLAAATL